MRNVPKKLRFLRLHFFVCNATFQKLGGTCTVKAALLSSIKHTVLFVCFDHVNSLMQTKFSGLTQSSLSCLFFRVILLRTGRRRLKMLNWQRTWRTDSITRWYRERIRRRLSKILELSLNWTWMKVFSPSSYWPDTTCLMPLYELNWTQVPVYCWQPSKTGGEWSCAKRGLNSRAGVNCGEATHIFRSLLSRFDILMLNSLVRIIILI